MSAAASNSDEQLSNKDLTAITVQESKTDYDNLDFEEADIALKLAKQAKGIHVTPEQDRKLLRKIDYYVTPVICVLYGLQYMDKTAISYSSIMGLRTDLKLVGQEYSWLTTGFYLGYLVSEPAAVRLLQRLPLIKTLFAYVFLWSVTLTLHAAVFNYRSVLVARIFLGGFEAAVSPALMIVTVQYFKKTEQFQRTAFWFSSNGFGNLIGGSIAYGIAKYQSHINIDSWKVLFIIFGLLTFLFSIFLFFHLPDTPSKAWFLTEDEKLIAVQRIRDNQQGYGNRKFKWHQFSEVFKDVRTYLYVLHGVMSTIPNGGLGSFGSILLNDSFGYSSLDALAMGLPCGAVQMASAVLFFSIVYWKGHRTLVGIGLYAISFVASCMLAFPANKRAQLAGYYLLNFGGLGWVTAISSIELNTLGYTKKSTVSAIYFVAYCVGNTIGPQTFQAKDAPNYVPAKISIAVLQGCSVGVLVIIYLYNVWENKRRDREAARLGDDYYHPPEDFEFLDLTDFENKHFRYVL